MSDFSFLKDYILPSAKQEDRQKLSHFKHFLFRVDESIITTADTALNIPLELKNFYQEIGYGFFFQQRRSSNNTFLSPDSFKIINLRQEYYEFDPDLELYESYPDKLIFFEVNEGVYLLIDKEDNKGKNAIYYFDEKIADSLEEFLRRFDAEGHYFE